MPLTPYSLLVFLSVFTLLFGSSSALAQQGGIREAIEEGNNLKGARDLCRSLDLMKKQCVVGSTQL